MANATNASNSAQLGGVAASSYVLTSDSRLSDARPPTAGSANYIQNTTSQQTANFNISGNGTVGGSLSTGTVAASSAATSILFSATSSAVGGTWLRLNNTSTGGQNWNIISTGSGNAEGAGKLLFNDQSIPATRLQLDGNGATINGSITANSATINGIVDSTVPYSKARALAAQGIANNSLARVQFDSHQYGTGVTFDDANDQLVIVTAGLYSITADILFESNATGYRLLKISLSTSGEVASTSVPAVNGADTILTVTTLARVNAGTSVFASCLQNSGGTLNTDTMNFRGGASLSVYRVGP